MVPRIITTFKCVPQIFPFLSSAFLQITPTSRVARAHVQRSSDRLKPSYSTSEAYVSNALLNTTSLGGLVEVQDSKCDIYGWHTNLISGSAPAYVAS